MITQKNIKMYVSMCLNIPESNIVFVDEIPEHIVLQRHVCDRVAEHELDLSPKINLLEKTIAQIPLDMNGNIAEVPEYVVDQLALPYFGCTNCGKVILDRSVISSVF